MRLQFAFGPAALLCLVSVCAAADKDGCWDVPQSCLSASGTFRDGSETTSLTNNCNDNVYAQICNQKRDGSWDCGESDVGPGRTGKNWSVDATGKYSIKVTGSVYPNNDWICTGKVSHWSDKPR